MIYLQEIFDTLATGEFASMKLGNSIVDTIAEGDYPRIVNAINLGLLDLHKKFPLRKGEFKVHQQSGVTDYYLRKEHSGFADAMDSYLYIELAEDEDWPDDLIKVNSVWQTDGTEIPFNDNRFKNDDGSGIGMGAFTPQFDLLRILPWTPLITMLVEYRARYPKIVITEDFNPETYEVNIPDYIEEPLLFFVASRVFRGIASKASEGEITSAVTYATLYRTACLQIEQSGLITSDNDHSQTFDNGGFC